jgi:hypothetical protein
MPPGERPRFFRRDEAFGIRVSFCRTCFMSVAEGHSDEDLTEGEGAHRCGGAPIRWNIKRPDVVEDVSDS